MCKRKSSPAYRSKWDAIGIGASLACAIHCVLLPLVLTTLTLFGIEILENMYLETATILVSMGAGGWALWRGYRQHHHNKWIFILFITGLCMMIAGNFFHHHQHTLRPVEMGLKLTGAAMVIIAHIRNWRGCNTCTTHHHEGESAYCQNNVKKTA